MISKNAQKFKSYLQSQGAEIKFIEGDDGDTYAEIRESLDSGVNLRILLIFDKKDTMVSVLGGDFITGMNPTKRNYMYEAVNDLNNMYTYYKYVLDKDRLTVQAFALFNDNFSCDVVMRLILGMMKAVEDEYPGLMRIMWA